MITKIKRLRKSFFQNNFSLVLVGILILAAFLVVTNIKIYQKRVKLISQKESLEKEIQILEKESELLKAKISQAGTKDYLEKVAREELGLKASGEKVIVVKEEEAEEEEIKEAEKSFWQKWWQIIFGK